MRRKFFLLLILVALGIISCKTDDSDSKNVLQKFSVTFDSDAGSNVKSQVIENGKTATKPENPTKDGYDFEGWLLGNSLFDFSTPITSDITLKAKWTKHTSTTLPEEQKQFFTVTFDTNGGSGIVSQKIENGKTVTKPENPAKDGYDFEGWILGDSPFDFSTPIISDITLKAKWIEVYTVTFDFDDARDNIEKEVIKGALVTSEDASWIKHRFDGWYLDGEKFDFSTPIISDITLKAKWIKICTVTFVCMRPDINTNTWNRSGSSIVKQIDEGHFTTPPFSAEEKVDWSGWYLGETKFDFENTPIVDDVELVGKIYFANIYNSELNLEKGWGTSQYNAPIFTVITDKYSSYTIFLTGMYGGWPSSFEPVLNKGENKIVYFEIKKSGETYRCYLSMGRGNNDISVAKASRDTTVPFYTNNYSLTKIERKGTLKNQWNREVDHIVIYVCLDF